MASFHVRASLLAQPPGSSRGVGAAHEVEISPRPLRRRRVGGCSVGWSVGRCVGRRFTRRRVRARSPLRRQGTRPRVRLRWLPAQRFRRRCPLPESLADRTGIAGSSVGVIGCSPVGAGSIGAAGSTDGAVDGWLAGVGVADGNSGSATGSTGTGSSGAGFAAAGAGSVIAGPITADCRRVVEPQEAGAGGAGVSDSPQLVLQSHSQQRHAKPPQDARGPRPAARQSRSQSRGSLTCPPGRRLHMDWPLS